MKLLKKQNGAVLITSLVMLVILTLLGLSGMQDASLEERMAGNMRSQNIAFQAAEAALRAGETLLASGVTPTVVDETFNSSWWRDKSAAWWANELGAENIYVYANDLEFKSGTNLSSSPRYVIEAHEQLCATAGVSITDTSCTGVIVYYRITARGVDETGRSEVILRTTYRTQVNQ